MEISIAETAHRISVSISPARSYKLLLGTDWLVKAQAILFVHPKYPKLQVVSETNQKSKVAAYQLQENLEEFERRIQESLRRIEQQQTVFKDVPSKTKLLHVYLQDNKQVVPIPAGSYKIRPYESLTIPAQSQKVVPLGAKFFCPKGQFMFFSSLPKLFETTGLSCANVVADRGYLGEANITIANLMDKPKYIQKGTIIGKVELESLSDLAAISPVCGFNELGLKPNSHSTNHAAFGDFLLLRMCMLITI